MSEKLILENGTWAYADKIPLSMISTCKSLSFKVAKIKFFHFNYKIIVFIEKIIDREVRQNYLNT